MSNKGINKYLLALISITAIGLVLTFFIYFQTVDIIHNQSSIFHSILLNSGSEHDLFGNNHYPNIDSILSSFYTVYPSQIITKDYSNIHSSIQRNTTQFGKAYVITIDRRLPDTVITAARACGFEPYIVEADRPWNTMYKNMKDFSNYCFGGKNVTIRNDMYPGEVALVGSHRKALKLIAMDESAPDNQWSLILESDARLHPNLMNGLYDAKAMVLEAINHHKQTNGYGWMYLGACSPKCHGYSHSSSSNKIYGSYSHSFSSSYSQNISKSGYVGMNCTGYCTHALAVTKKRAQSIYEEIYCIDPLTNKKTDCGCHRPLCHTDQSLVGFFKNPITNPYQPENPKIIPSAMIVGPNMQSPHIPDHFGLLYQCCRDDELIKSGNGTTLKKIAFISPPPMNCYSMEYGSVTGNIGDVMFQYAALVGICIQYGYQYDYCAGLSSGIDGISLSKAMAKGYMSEVVAPGSSKASIKLLRQVFNLPEVVCPINHNMVYHEKVSFPYWKPTSNGPQSGSNSVTSSIQSIATHSILSNAMEIGQEDKKNRSNHHVSSGVSSTMGRKYIMKYSELFRKEELEKKIEKKKGYFRILQEKRYAVVDLNMNKKDIEKLIEQMAKNQNQDPTTGVMSNIEKDAVLDNTSVIDQGTGNSNNNSNHSNNNKTINTVNTVNEIRNIESVNILLHSNLNKNIYSNNINANTNTNNNDKKTLLSRYDIKVSLQQPGTLLQGNFQSHKYFHPYAKSILLKVFTFVPSLTNTIDFYLRVIRSKPYPNWNKIEPINTISTINVINREQLGDLTCLSIPLSYDSIGYYEKAIEYIRSYRNIQNMKLLFLYIYKNENKHVILHSERMLNEIKQKYSLNHLIYHSTEHWNTIESMYAMSKCDNIILPPSGSSGSSTNDVISWWSAYLSQKYMNNPIPPIVLVPKYIPKTTIDMMNRYVRGSSDNSDSSVSKDSESSNVYHNIDVKDYKSYDDEDFYLPEWIRVEYEE